MSPNIRSMNWRTLSAFVMLFTLLTCPVFCLGDMGCADEEPAESEHDPGHAHHPCLCKGAFPMTPSADLQRAIGLSAFVLPAAWPLIDQPADVCALLNASELLHNTLAFAALYPLLI